MGGNLQLSSTNRNETVLEYQNRTKMPVGAGAYLAEAISDAFNGKGSKDPLKILSKTLNNYSESPYYKVAKKVIKKTGEAAIWLIDKSGFLINKDIPPYGFGFDNALQQGKSIYM